MRQALAVALALLLSSILAGCMQPQGPATNATLLQGDQRGIEAANVTFEGFRGYLAEPSGGQRLPGVVMIHEWWGLNEHIRDMARTLATHGYQVLAVDLFHGQVATTAEQARNQTQALDRDEAVRNLVAASSYLRDRGAAEVGSLGWCFGGGQSLQLALTGEPLAATVLYYGSPVSNETQLAAIQGPVLGIFGDRDTGIPVERVRAFEAAMDNLSIPNDVHIYPGVGHAFANPSGSSYAPVETKDAWAKTTAFLAKNLKKMA